MKPNRLTTSMAAVALAAGLSATVGAPAQAVTAADTGRHCLLLSGGGMQCADSEAAIRAVDARINPLVRFYENKNFGGLTLSFYARNCSETTGDIDYNNDMGEKVGKISSVRKYADGNCNWQLVGPEGARSTWVEGSWADLSTLGNGWNNRAARYRLT